MVELDSVNITVRQWTALRQGNLAGGGLADWRTDSAKSAAPAEWAAGFTGQASDRGGLKFRGI